MVLMRRQRSLPTIVQTSNDMTKYTDMNLQAMDV